MFGTVKKEFPKQKSRMMPPRNHHGNHQGAIQQLGAVADLSAVGVNDGILPCRCPHEQKNWECLIWLSWWFNWYLTIKIRDLIGFNDDTMAGWWLTYPSETYDSQLGWWHSQYMQNRIHVPNHQPTRNVLKKCLPQCSGRSREAVKSSLIHQVSTESHQMKSYEIPHETPWNPNKPHETPWNRMKSHIHRWLSPPNPTTSTGPSLLRSLGIVSRTSSSAVPETSWGTKDWGNPWWILSGQLR